MKLFLQLTMGLMLTMVTPYIYAQQLKVSVGVENKLTNESQEIKILGTDAENIYVLHKIEDYKYEINTYTHKTNYSITKTKAFDISTVDEKSKPDLLLAEHSGNYIYLIINMKKKGKVDYWAVKLNVLLEGEMEWKKIWTTEMNGLYLNIHNMSQDIWFMPDVSTIILSAGNWSAMKKINFEFEEVDDEEEQIEEEPEFVKKDLITLNAFNLTLNNGNKLYINYTSTKNIEERTKVLGRTIKAEVGPKFLSYVLCKPDGITKITEGEVIDIPKGYQLKDIQCKIDDSSNVIVYGYYLGTDYYWSTNDNGESIELPDGFFFIKYDLSIEDAKVFKQIKFGKDIIKKMKESASISESSEGKSRRGNLFELEKRPSGNYFFINSNWKINYLSSFSNFQMKDLFMIALDSQGNLLNMEFTKRFSKRNTEDKFITQNVAPFAFFDSSGKFYYVYSDAENNYYNEEENKEKVGEYNGEDYSDWKNACLAVTEVDEAGNYKRKLLFGSIEDKFGVELMVGTGRKLSKNEWIWLGYKDGISKIITVSLD